MATAKKTTKKTTKKTVKRTPAPKPVVEVVQEEPVKEEPVQKTAEQLRWENERKIAQGEKNVIQEIKKSEKEGLIRFHVPRDSTSGDGYAFERSINGHFIRLKAGDTVELPEYIVKFIEKSLTIQRISEKKYDMYKGSGVNLT